MNLLIDTNILIRAEPTSPEDLEVGSPIVVELARLINEGGHRLFIHPASITELAGDRNQVRRKARALLVRKYSELPVPPEIDQELSDVLGTPPEGSNDEVDLRLIAAVFKDSVHILVTDDQKLHRKADRAGLGDRVLFPGQAVVVLRGLFPQVPEPPPAVRKIYSHELDENDEIFASFRDDYHEFDNWLVKAKQSHRLAWVIDSPRGGYAGICIVKEESPDNLGLGKKTLKICSFKISSYDRGRRYGELLLKAVFQYGQSNSFEWTYVTAFSKQLELLNLLGAFGFRVLSQTTKSGELILAKPLKPGRDAGDLDPVEYHIQFGPKYFKSEGVSIFVVPIRQKYHDLLFPELLPQLGLFSENFPFGNSIRKAYLCNSPIRCVSPGDLLLFYRSGSNKSINSIGVVEATLVGTDPEKLSSFVGQRTVYSLEEIEVLCQRSVLAILFRQAVWGDDLSMTLDLLQSEGVLRGPPQSITQVREGGEFWVRKALQWSH